MFSKTYGYALRAAVYIAVHGRDGKRVGLHDLSQQLDIPHHFLGKIMQDLVRHGVLDSLKGPTGGFYANDRTLNFPLIDLLKITDGSAIFESCVLGIKRCNSANRCPVHNDYAVCRNGMLQALSEKTVGMMADVVERGEAYLAR